MKVRRFTKLNFLLFILAVLVFSYFGISYASIDAAETGTTYYVDAVAGNDSYAGNSESAPWKTLSKVQSFTDFQPGDQILLKAGSVWNESLEFNYSGDENHQITIGKYGNSDDMPIVNGGGREYAIKLNNAEYITLQDIEVTNYDAKNPEDYKAANYRRSGVLVAAYHQGVKHNIQIKNMDIHHVNGMSLTGEEWAVPVGRTDASNKNHNAGIMVNGWSWENPDPAPSYYVDLLIEDNYIHDVSTIGINIDGHEKASKHLGVIIRNNTVIGTGADAIEFGAIKDPLIEHNIGYDIGINGHNYKWIAGMWGWSTDGAIYQYNEVARVQYESKQTADSAAFDTDINATGDHIYQYNYSHDNEGGFMMNMGHLKDGNNIIRYNISQNDKHNGFTNTTLNLNDPATIYNNVFYNDIGTGIVIKDNPDVTFINNIFYTKGNLPYPTDTKFYNNCFYGHLAPRQGINNIVADPGFINPGQGGDGINTVNGYQLKPDSILIGAGYKINDNGGKDYWGNPLYTGSPDIGAFESPDSNINDTVPPSAPTDLKVISKSDTKVTLSWSAVEKGGILDVDVYNSSNDKLLASVMMGSECTIDGLDPSTEYSFYFIARDKSGNPSVKSEILKAATTIASIIVDDTDAITTGVWTKNAAGNACYKDSYLTIAAGTGKNNVTWTPTLPVDGYYEVYYWLPKGSNRADDAKYTVAFDGGTKTYHVNQKVSGGKWVLLGIHKFKAGTAGYVNLSDNANGEVAADAVKFLLKEGFGLNSIKKVVLTSSKLQLRVGEKTNISVIGVDAMENTLDLVADNLKITYKSANTKIATVSEGIITAVGNGKTTITADVAVGGQILTSNSVEVFVGPQFVIEACEFEDALGNELTAFTPYGVARAYVRVINSTEASRKVALIEALYTSDDILLAVDTQEAVIKQYENITLSTQLSLPVDVKDTYIKVFVWDGLSTMRPLAAVTIFEPEQGGNTNPTPIPTVKPTPVPTATPTPAPSKNVISAGDFKAALKTGKDYTVAVKDESGKVKYSWTFTKQNLAKANKDFTDVDISLGVKKLDNNSAMIGDGNHHGLVITFAHEGRLPVQASVRIYVGGIEGIEPNSKLYLYYYNSKTGKLDELPFSSGYQVDNDGYVTINIVHCSDYVLLTEEADSSIYTSLIDQISVTPVKKTLYLGEKVNGKTTLQVKLPSTLELVKNLKDDTSGTSIGAVTVSYRSSNKKVATVNSKGEVTAKSAGTAKITTTIKLYSGKTKSFTTTVTVKKPSIKITKTTATMKVGDDFIFKAEALGFDKKNIEWTTTKKSVVVINKKTGKAVAKSVGTDYVVAKIGNTVVKIKVVVKK